MKVMPNSRRTMNNTRRLIKMSRFLLYFFVPPGVVRLMGPAGGIGSAR